MYNQIINVEAYQSTWSWTNESGVRSSITSSGTVNAGMGPIGISLSQDDLHYLFKNSKKYDDYILINFGLYEFKIYETDTLFREYIPVKRISDNVIGLYELNTNTFLTNVGSGTFLGGPVI